MTATRSMTPRPLGHDLLDRPSLHAVLDRAVAHKLTIIAAPPGSGKTSLLRTWAQSSGPAVRVAFASVPRDHDDPHKLWGVILEALRPSLDEIDPHTRGQTPVTEGQQGVDAILSALADQPGRLVLILDDLHELTSPAVFGDLERLLADLPSSAALILATRRDPPIRLHRDRLDGEVTELRAADLRFDEGEARDLLASSGVTLSEAGVALLHQRTEGWVAGLRLAALSLGGHADPERFVAEFSGNDRAVGEYLLAEMLGRQPADVQRLLLRTSIVDRVNGELADLLASHHGSERVLLELEDANAFVMSLDSRRVWFRYHQLLLDFLRLELRRTIPDEVNDLHRRAAAWFLQHGYLVEAIKHTQTAGDWEQAAQMLADHVFRLVIDGHTTTIGALLRSFPPRLSDGSELALAHAAVQVGQGRLDEAAAQLDLAETHLRTIDAERGERLMATVTALRLAHAVRAFKVAGVSDHLSPLASPISANSTGQIEIESELRALGLMSAGTVELWSGRFADAERHLCEAAELAEKVGRGRLELVCRARHAEAAESRSLHQARQRSAEAIAFAARHGWQQQPEIVPALVTLAATSAWTGDFGTGEEWMRSAQGAGQGGLEPGTVLLMHRTAGMLHAARGAHDQALEAFDAAGRVQCLLTDEHVLAAQVSGWRVASQARLGHLGEAHASLAALPDRRALCGEVDNARAVLCLADDDPHGALDALRGVLDAQAPVLGVATVIEAHLLTGQAHLQLEDPRAAAAAAEAALASAEPDRLVLPFAITASLELMQRLPRHETAHSALLVEIIDLLRGEPSGRGASARDVESVGLSPSELRVLRFLPTNLTRSEIARELYISVNTVNTHLRNIYSKLDSRDRSTAVQRARELRLLSTALSRVVRS